MDDKNWLQGVSPILKPYAVEPYFVEDFNKVKKIYSNKGVFALKQMNPHQGTDFIRFVQNLYQKGFNRIVPVYPAVDGRYAVLHDNSLYYLMPWLPNSERENHSERYQQLFRELARLHTLSAKEIKINKEERTEHYENTQLEIEKENEFLQGFIEECEKKVYMSPFELLFCLYYHDLSQALRFAENKLKEWYEKTKDDEKTRVVILHGKVSIEHFLYDERGYGYFTNFEKATLGSPTHDLLPFFSRTFNCLPKRNEDCVEWVYTYFKYFPFKNEEMLLFLSYLAHPGPVLKVAERYYKDQRKKNERKYVEKLQKQYWALKNTEYFVMRIDEIERQKQQAQEQEGAQDH